jgi:hypothetical protein
MLVKTAGKKGGWEATYAYISLLLESGLGEVG